MSVIQYDLIGSIGIINVDSPPVNALSHAVREGIQKAIVSAQDDASQAIVIHCKGRTFIAGADITEFGKPPKSPSLPDLLETIEASNKIIIAALHGTALGGGVELALACDYRLAVASAKVGLPEVKLGLLPGAGGTQRTPRLAGIEAALDLISSGNPIPASKAKKLNLLDKIVDDKLLDSAIEYANHLIDSQAPKKRVSEITIDSSTVPEELFHAYRDKLAKRARGQLAPQNIVSCIEAAVSKSFSDGLALERTLFMECMHSPQSSALRHLFFAERTATKIKGLSKDTPQKELNTVAIIGGGTMGSGIAMNFANAGIPATLVEISEDSLTKSFAIIEKNYSASVKRGKLTEEQKQQCQRLITGTTNYNDIANTDLVIEAVFENVDLKKEIFTKLDSICKRDAILATNTSYQDIDQIANATQRPENVIGLHFFSPANIMKLLEVVRGEKTSDTVIATSMSLAKKIKKIPVLAGNCYGFIGNRMLRPYGREAQLCLIEGSSPEQIDTVMQNFGMAMGPLAVSDLAGLDIGYRARETLTAEEKGDPKTYCIADALVEMDRLGQKTGAGFYQYDPDTRQRISDPETMSLVKQQAQKHGVERKQMSDEDILNRLIFSLVNEGAKILQEGIAQRPSDIDIVYVFGYGFPSYRGGPMQYADSIGLSTVYDTICKFSDKHGAANWTPAPLLKELAESNSTFDAWARQNS